MHNNKLQIIGITGKAQAGKSTTASFLEQKIKDKGYTPIRHAFAKPLKEIANQIYPDMDFYNNKETVDFYYNRSPRQVLQILGTDIARSIYHNTWVDMTERIILDLSAKLTAEAPPTVVIIDDIRFPNEYNMLSELHNKHDIQFTFLSISRGEKQKNWKRWFTRVHESEKHHIVLQKYADIILENNTTLSEYNQKLELAWKNVIL